ncbi:MAG: glycosyltransferase [Opitutaceae bacterium]|jgi:glycosyltransferase involved in cell wall biosynthesis|nr:glycosyltransferase [Opitutaceae bacterium]
MENQNLPSRATVALVDWTMSGHHDTYMRLFARTLLDGGHRVIALWPEPGRLPGAPESQEGAASNPRFASAYFHRPKCLLAPRSLRYWAEAGIAARNMKNAIAACEKRLGEKCDFIFFNTLYEKQHWLVQALADAGARPWSFLYLHTSSLPPHSHENPGMMRLLQHPMLRAIGVLDERSITPGGGLTGRRFVRFPDFTDESRVPGHPFERELRAFKGDAPLVLSIGHLRKEKGVMTLAGLAQNPAARSLRFAFVGECRLKGRERDVMDRLRHNANVLLKLGRIPGEAAYNACICASDVLFAAYHDFNHSSNTLTKAAVFEKPVIVSADSLMAERTLRHRLGEVVRQKDIESTLEGITRITNDCRGWINRANPDYEGYRRLHSKAQLHQAFDTLLREYDLR